MCCVASSLSLLALVAGAFLLAKTRKDELGTAFKWLSYFVIFYSLTIFVCSAAHDLASCMGCKKACPAMSSCEGNSDCVPRGGSMGGHGCDGMPATCPMMGHGSRCEKMSSSECEGMKSHCSMDKDEDEEKEDSIAGH